jgi:2-polyprenyl-3-methyl-5-hydroxy-6-metoxy-1,4-benzoquinol methylase
VIDGLGMYDAVVCMEMIEHLTKKRGEQLIRKMLNHATGCVVVTTPDDVGEQGMVYGNPAEVHRSCWTADDFRNIISDLDIDIWTKTHKWAPGENAHIIAVYVHRGSPLWKKMHEQCTEK